MLDLAKHIVNQKAGRFDPEKFEDQYETALIELINQKRAGKPIVPKERPAASNVVNLMEALRRSVGGAASAKAGKPAKKPRKAVAGQKEMLMPIEGKKVAREVAKKPTSRSQRKSAQNVVTIEGNKPEKSDREFLYRGISTRHFKRQFNLADYVQVKNASFDNGLLKIELVREIPEAMKPRRIAINGSNVHQLEAKVA
jgi:hypothetical protein